jgi:peptidoglycan/LPS O-acetylase OafA/YrhL
MTKPLKTTDRRQDIQGLRAISVILVVLFHVGLPVPGGFTGVDIFFVISGYVITHSFSLEWSRSGTIRLGSFFVRRVRRLLAALAVVIAFTTVV